jgi:ribosomal protein L11 methyltransferase
VNASPALVLHFPSTSDVILRDRLVALLADHGLLAIQEDDVAAPRMWLAHFATRAARDAAKATIAALPDARELRVETTEVDDEDWARRTQADLPAVRVGRLIVAPPWDLPANVDGRAANGQPVCRDALRALPSSDVVIIIEPSRGFGTGHHESTRLSLVLLQSRDLTGRSVLDVGTGSGVLAIAAAKLGATFVSAIDIDPDAVENARENIERNGVASAVEAHVRDFIEDHSLAAAEIVTANLTGTLLARHAHDLARLVRPAGSLIVAGFTADERDMVIDAFAPAFAVSESAEEAGWWAFVMAAPSSHAHLHRSRSAGRPSPGPESRAPRVTFAPRET